MLKQLFSLARQILNFAQETERNRSDIKELRQELKELTAVIQRLIYEQRSAAELETQEREKLLLRLQNELLRFERRLPGGRARD